jgi:hypothetical protein
MPAEEGPAAFGVEKLVKPKLWVVFYKGKIVVSHTAWYRFVGFADDACEVAIDKKTVLDGSKPNPANVTSHPSITDVINYPSQAHYTYNFPTALPDLPKVNMPFACGDWIQLQEGQPYEMDVLIGEYPGGQFGAWLMVERKDYSYEKTANGSPILPLFRVSNVKMPAVDVGCPPYDKRDIEWSTVGDDSDSADMMQNNAVAPANPAN